MLFELAPFAVPAGYGDSIISLDDAKAHIGVENGDDDDLIGVMRDAAIDMTEQYCGLRLLSQPAQIWKSEALYGSLNLGIGPLVSVESISYLDSEGATVALVAADWRLGLHDTVCPAIGKQWPSGVAGGVRVEFTAGFVANEVPASLLAAAKMFMAHLYLNRESVVVGASAVEVPLGFRMLCDQHRMPNI